MQTNTPTDAETIAALTAKCALLAASLVQAEASARPVRPPFTPFNWLSEDAQRYPLADFANSTRDMAAGIATILEMIEDSQLEQDSGGAPAIGVTHCGNLIRFAIASAHQLHQEAVRRGGWLNKRGAEQAKEMCGAA